MKLHLIAAALGAALLTGARPALAATIGEDAGLCQSGKGPAIQVNVQGLKDRTGELWLELYPESPGDYLRPDTELIAEGKTFRRARAALPANGEVAICVRVPRAGRYRTDAAPQSRRSRQILDLAGRRRHPDQSRAGPIKAKL